MGRERCGARAVSCASTASMRAGWVSGQLQRCSARRVYGGWERSACWAQLCCFRPGLVDAGIRRKHTCTSVEDKFGVPASLAKCLVYWIHAMAWWCAGVYLGYTYMCSVHVYISLPKRVMVWWSACVRGITRGAGERCLAAWRQLPASPFFPIPLRAWRVQGLFSCACLFVCRKP